MAEMISCKNLCKSYKNKEVLHSINLDIESGKIYGLIGRNGAGKTTLLSIMSSQNPKSSGEVTLNGENVWENRSVVSKICFSRELNSGSTAATAALKIKDYIQAASIYYDNWDADYANRLMKDFGLNPKDKLFKLSKGMLSMVTIIVALASKCEYTFLDEPVAGLDIVMRDKFYKLLIDEYTETGRTFIVSTHIIDEASSIFEEVIVVDDGKILLKDNTDELLSKCVHVSGKEEAVDKAVDGLATYHEEKIGRSKGVTVMLEEGQSVSETPDVSVQPITLQQLFLALCGDK